MLLPAHLHDSQVLEDLLDIELIADQGRKRPAYADSAYRAESHEVRLAGLEMDSHIREKSMVRTRAEQTFGAPGRNRRTRGPDHRPCAGQVKD